MTVSVLLVCLPFAGAGASFFRPWRTFGVAGVDVHPVQLPGRERLIDRPPYVDVHEAVAGILPDLLPLATGDRPVALFGHSLGAVIAFELARALEAAGRAPAHLFASGSPAPGSPREQAATGLDDAAFLATVERFAGYRHPVLDDPEMRALILPALRADVEMHEAYRPRTGAPIGVPVTALRGSTDALVSRDAVAGWSVVTTGGCRHLELPGGHMYLTELGATVLTLVASTVGDHATAGR
jgi:surfactin synthase thioesterase subunit